MVIICFGSIFLGSFALALVVAVMNGFEKETCKKLQGIHASVNIDAYGERLHWPAIKKVLDEEFPHVIASTPTATKQVIVTIPGSDDISNVVALRAIEPRSQQNVTTLTTMIQQKTIPLHEIIKKNTILIGNSLSQSLGAGMNDTISILFISDDITEQSHGITFDQYDGQIGGVFKTGIDEFDSHIIYCSFDFFNKLFPESGVSQIELKLEESAHEQNVIALLKKRLKLNVYSWKKLYPALVSALKLEKYAMFLILSLIILVASMNIMSLLFTQTVQKQCDIAILKALGMSNKHIRYIFLSMGMLIAFLASASGLLAAYITSLVLKTYPFIKLPDAYYATHLPVSIDVSSFLFIFLTILLICFMATWASTYKTTRITISTVLRFGM